MPHRAVSNLIQWQQTQTEPGVDARTLQYASLGFDVSCQEMFATWAGGGTLILVDEAVRRDPVALLRYIDAQQVTRLFLPYVALRQVAEVAAAHELYPATLREVITAGEPLQVTPALAKMITAVSHCRLVNQYGPSETHVVTAHTLPSDPAAWPMHPPIGTPIANTQIYLLDQNGEPVPIGVSGELVIGGSGVAHGYLNRPKLTA